MRPPARAGGGREGSRPAAGNLTGMPPPTMRRRRPPTPPRQPHDPRYEIAASVARSEDPGGDPGVVVDLAGHRARRLLADLGLAPTVEVPCSGCCRCFGVPVGLECRS
jgi:hypothetical protein